MYGFKMGIADSFFKFFILPYGRQVNLNRNTSIIKILLEVNQQNFSFSFPLLPQNFETKNEKNIRFIWQQSLIFIREFFSLEIRFK
ncbi:MAG: hypothetical protein COW85_01885 [Ignavibacteria bacterium CG22_combo_CG10-13_8_21_14_all_37_15]|nr:MAG: hypothetical protein COW85_01885 [Ignavibacteria bacterium CG22_combo_CG10-13_8_21_14_all_37_15]PJC59743.1 MAG: hypothetical protein CO025_05280 [Ignavibacteria bacterium CG_4_9_14_0_2_um_filter_37_13]